MLGYQAYMTAVQVDTVTIHYYTVGGDKWPI